MKKEVIDMSEAEDKSKAEASRRTPWAARFAIAFVWCWASGLVSCLIMADSGTMTLEGLPVDVYMSFLGIFVGPLFFVMGLLPGDAVPACVGVPLAFAAYIPYITLLWSAITSRRASVRYAALTVIAIASFIAWQGLRNSIGP